MKIFLLMSFLFVSGCSIASVKWIEKNYETNGGIIAYETKLGFQDASSEKARKEIENFCKSNYKIISEGESETINGFVYNNGFSSASKDQWNNVKFQCIKN